MEPPLPIFTYADLYNDKNVARTKEIFCEHSDKGILTYGIDEKPGKINLRKLYMNFCVEDPSEVKFAENVFGDLTFWNKLANSIFFKDVIEEWRFVATEKRKCLAFEAIIDEVKSKGKSSFTAAKYLIEEPWLKGATATEKKLLNRRVEETARAAFNSKHISEDLERLKQEGIIN